MHDIKFWQTIVRTNPKLLPADLVLVTGRVRTNRASTNVGFLEINDGSSMTNLQVVYKKHLINFMMIAKIKIGTYVIVKGGLINTKQKLQALELQAEMVQMIADPAQKFAIQKSYHSPSYLRTIQHLRVHTQVISAINRVKSFLMQKINDFFKQNHFFYVIPPIISRNDVEGGGEVFYLTTQQTQPAHHFFKTPVNLIVSSQMYLEALAQSLARVYTVVPVFRAEKSSTSRHAAEFSMLEIELINTNLDQVMDLAQKLIVFLIRSYLDCFNNEIKFFESYSDCTLTPKLRLAAAGNYQRINYDQIIKILRMYRGQFKNQNIFWGMNLELEHEKFIAHHLNEIPCFVFDFPKVIKPFYMKTNPDDQTVSSFDLLLFPTGELIGGSVREEHYQVLVQNCHQKNMNLKLLTWYLELRNQAYAPSAGFGVGIDRLVMYLTGINNIRDIISFPQIYHEPGL